MTVPTDQTALLEAARAWAAEDPDEQTRSELEALVAISSPSGDVHGAEECAAICAALMPDAASVERIPCSSPAHASDLLATLRGTGTRRILLLGHVDTVIAHPHHRPLTRAGHQLLGSGTVGTGCLLEIKDQTLGRYLEPGDEVALTIGRLGTLRTPIIDRPM